MASSDRACAAAHPQDVGQGDVSSPEGAAILADTKRSTTLLRLAAVAAGGFMAEWFVFFLHDRLAALASKAIAEAARNLILIYVSWAFAALVMRARGVRHSAGFPLWAMMLGGGTAIVLLALLSTVLVLAAYAPAFESALQTPAGVVVLMAVASVGFVVIASAVVSKGLRDQGKAIRVGDSAD